MYWWGIRSDIKKILWSIVILLAFASFFVALSGCATQGKLEEKLDSNLGKNIDEIIERAGPPNSMADLHNGGRVYAWQVYANSTFFDKMNGSLGGTCNVRYTTDSDGMILKYSYSGQFCKM
jgi:hypothetical protein